MTEHIPELSKRSACGKEEVDFVFLRQDLTKQARLVLNLGSSCLSFLSAGTIGMPHLELEEVYFGSFGT
jgi:hypothetical protein